MEPFERILVRAPNPLGDAVMATPLLRALRRNWPRARVTVLATAAGAEVYRGLDTVDRIEVIRRKEAHGLLGCWKAARPFRSERFDLAVVCPNSHSSALHAWFTGAKRRTGWAYNGRGLLLTDPLGPEMERWGKRIPVPMVEYYLDLVRNLGAEVVSTATELRTTPEGEREALGALEAGGWREGAPLAGLAVGSSFGPSKLWTPEAFAAVGNGLSQRGIEVALLYGPGEEDVAAAVAARLDRAPVLGASKALGIGGLKSVCSRLSILVTTDTGPRHVAVAFGVPVVVVMGPTDPRYTASNLERTVVLREEVDCAPYHWPCHEKDCPLDGPRRHRCMEGIPAERAVSAATGLMAKFPR
jgi:heptosyltransferase-2